jgi:hypothetical protein
VTANTLSDIEEESTLISDNTSNFSENNSRNFQMPEKNFIDEISRQRENSYCNGDDNLRSVSQTSDQHNFKINTNESNLI